MPRDQKLLFLSFISINIFLWLQGVEFKYGIPQIVKYIFSLSSLIVIIRYGLKNPFRPKLGGLFNPLLIFFVGWSIFLLISSILTFNSLFYFQRLFGQRFFFIPYLLPLFIVFTKFDLSFFRNYLMLSLILIIPALLFQVMLIGTGVSPSNWTEQTATIYIFDIGSWLLILSVHYFRKRYVSFIVVIYFSLWVVLWALYGRRGMLIETLLLFIIMIYFRLKSPLLSRNDRMKIYFSGITLAILLISFGYIVTSTYAFQRGISKEGFEESRGEVFENFYQDFNSASDWVIGRGLDGRVMRTIIRGEDSGDLIENGFLHLVLKGGLLYLIPYVMILLKASYLGFFKSNNDLVKGLASLLLIQLIMMFYHNLPDYSVRYILVWIAVSACFNKELRDLNNTDVLEAIHNRSINTNSR